MTTHNWNQVHEVLLKKGYHQVQDYDNDYLYYIDGGKTSRITVPKANKLDEKLLDRILNLAGIPYNEFVVLYRVDSV